MTLSEENRLKLARYTGYPRDAMPEYEAPLPWLVVDAYAVFDEWLERAVHAGHVPTREGCEAALIACHLEDNQFLDDSRTPGELVFSAEASADWYRKLAAMLERYAAEADRRAADAHRDSPNGTSAQGVAGDPIDARRAELRAERASERAAAAEEDSAPQPRTIRQSGRT